MKIAHACAIAGLVVPGIAAATTLVPNCTPDSCNVTVTVSGAGCGGGISVSPEPIIVAKSKGPTAIKWTVAGTQWAFADKGIVVNKADNEFDVPPQGKDKKQFAVTFKNTKSGTYKYDINLASTGNPSVPCSVDPTILNY